MKLGVSSPKRIWQWYGLQFEWTSLLGIIRGRDRFLEWKILKKHISVDAPSQYNTTSSFSPLDGNNNNTISIVFIKLFWYIETKLVIYDDTLKYYHFYEKRQKLYCTVLEWITYYDNRHTWTGSSYIIDNNTYVLCSGIYKYIYIDKYHHWSIRTDFSKSRVCYCDAS